jgi:hypothetical protein
MDHSRELTTVTHLSDLPVVEAYVPPGATISIRQTIEIHEHSTQPPVMSAPVPERQQFYSVVEFRKTLRTASDGISRGSTEGSTPGH